MKERLTLLMSSFSHVIDCLATEPHIRRVMPSEMNRFSQGDAQLFPTISQSKQ